MTASSGVLRRRRAGPALSVAGNGVVLTGAVVAGLLAGEGWLYVLRGAGWLDAGPNVGDSLPLLALAGADGQPLLRVLISWLLAGAMAAVVMVRLPCAAPGGARRRAVPGPAAARVTGVIRARAQSPFE